MKHLLFLFLLSISVSSFAGTTDKKVEELLKNEITAIEKNDFKAFVSNGTEVFKRLPLANFKSVVQQLSERFKKGHETIFLTTLNHDKTVVYLWKITFKDKGNDVVANMILDKENKILGFWLQ